MKIWCVIQRYEKKVGPMKKFRTIEKSALLFFYSAEKVSNIEKKFPKASALVNFDGIWFGALNSKRLLRRSYSQKSFQRDTAIHWNTVQHSATHFLRTSYSQKTFENFCHGVAVRCSVLQCVAVCCSVLQGVAVCCSVLQCVAVSCSVLQCVAACCSVLQWIAVCCSVLQCLADRHSEMSSCWFLSADRHVPQT